MTTRSKNRPGNATPKRRNVAGPAANSSIDHNQPTKLDLLVEKLAQPDGASLADLTAATGWQVHSVRGALAGSLKKKGHIIVSEKIGDVRRYRIEAAR